ncbi:MAG: 3',5'-cyclic-nucleotide phosphodiesterase [Thermodesulfovibrionales bacterium]|nr:3',5'-cyclic-nucleotide phosphodiesterase [Thermodesulfovibrionales bacterium]
MKIKVIGCSGAEFPGHNPPSFLLDKEIVFDAGSITNVLDRKAQLKIKHIFITHAHLDHILSIPFLADNIIVGNKGRIITLYSIAPVIRTIRNHLFNSEVWPDFTLLPNPKEAILNLTPLKAGRTITVNGYSVTPYKVNHPVPAVGYLVEDRGGKLFFYTGDTGPTRQTWKQAGKRQLDALIIDVSFPNNMRELAITTGHLTPDLLGEEIKHMPCKPRRVYVTHLKPQYSRRISVELRKLLLRHLKILKDGDTIRI